ncbi:uncharacterized protein LOC132608160 [Lycium barbarum]|uniref:uncharacterized protein LOC132608160 n=1 Tax=Lycium barbarum TaxID=112863 RepID=UPI00293F38E9|nr:uncharacterized protein LOC132608160 [Lycium barbarum]
MVVGLTEAYKNVGTYIQQSKPLPSFSEAQSSLCLEEKALAEMHDDSPSAMMANSQREFDDSTPMEHSGRAHHHRGKNNHKNRGSSGGKNNGGGRGSGSGNAHRRHGGRDRQQAPMQQ